MTSFVSRYLSLCCSLCLLLGCSFTLSVEVKVGATITLACKYDARYYGKLSVCWGQGPIPNRGCDNELIKTDGTSVSSRLSERYLLTGNIGEGDVSLTITQVAESDSGVYGCRVEIPGWFNDHKHQVTLTVVPACPDALKVEMREVGDRTVTVRWSRVFDGGRPIKSYRIDLKSKDALWDAAVMTHISNPNLTQVSLVDLRPAKYYNLRMFAVNSQGMSNASNVLTVATKEAAPEGPPLDVRLQATSSTSIRVSWKPPRADLRNGILRSYSIRYREYDPAGGHVTQWYHQSVTAAQPQESRILSGLRPSTQYGVLVQAKTNAGVGPASGALLCSTLDEPLITSTEATFNTLVTVTWPTLQTTKFISDLTTPAGELVFASTAWEQTSTGFSSVPPDPPFVQLKEVSDNTVSFSWTPGFEGDAPISGYFLEYKASNGSWDFEKTVVDFGPNQREATVVEINPFTYNIRMFAKSSLGKSKASNILTFTTGGQQNLFWTTTTINIHSATSSGEGGNGHLAAIVVPLVLVILLVVAIVTIWRLRRIKVKKGNFSLWLSRGAILYRGSESMQEL
ncbi:cell adhesion molecule DSCAML1-like isoform X2 [Syngnathoides biaculeatus]|uniref:cell adhesion molecule DSCAML1-like isoform X2 n=1 Tax=Syngnathoides biaculeatus TaxID=300417 RepID=UPI002ADE6F6D|nr:cell adhesion molecule DSCAML1-like isoform X2 [Syngnathoides biaculeatus]